MAALVAAPCHRAPAARAWVSRRDDGTLAGAAACFPKASNSIQPTGRTYLATDGLSSLSLRRVAPVDLRLVLRPAAMLLVQRLMLVVGRDLPAGDDQALHVRVISSGLPSVTTRLAILPASMVPSTRRPRASRPARGSCALRASSPERPVGRRHPGLVHRRARAVRAAGAEAAAGAGGEGDLDARVDQLAGVLGRGGRRGRPSSAGMLWVRPRMTGISFSASMSATSQASRPPPRMMSRSCSSAKADAASMSRLLWASMITRLPPSRHSARPRGAGRARGGSCRRHAACRSGGRRRASRGARSGLFSAFSLASLKGDSTIEKVEKSKRRVWMAGQSTTMAIEGRRPSPRPSSRRS